jgi:hypothetical protein
VAVDARVDRNRVVKLGRYSGAGWDVKVAVDALECSADPGATGDTYTGRSIVLMNKDDKPRPPRFRIVLEISFEAADPCDPSGYSDLLSQWAESLHNEQIFKCRDVKLIECLTIGDADDYSDWRYHRGAYDLSRGEGIRFDPNPRNSETG